MLPPPIKDEQEKSEFAYSNPSILAQKFIPAQTIKTSNKESFIIEYKGVSLQAIRGNKENEPLFIYLNGTLIATLNRDEKREIPFNIDTNTHILSAWNGRASYFFLTNLIRKHGLAITIDGVPVKGTLADPMIVLKEGKFGIWAFAAFLGLKVISTLISFAHEGLFTLLFYLAFVALILFSAFTFSSNPRRSLWIGIIVGIIEVIDFTGGWFIKHSGSHSSRSGAFL